MTRIFKRMIFVYVCEICERTSLKYGVFNLTSSIVFRFADSNSPLHMERGGEMLDYRSHEGVRWSSAIEVPLFLEAKLSQIPQIFTDCILCTSVKSVSV